GRHAGRFLSIGQHSQGPASSIVALIDTRRNPTSLGGRILAAQKKPHRARKLRGGAETFRFFWPRAFLKRLLSASLPGWVDLFWKEPKSRVRISGKAMP